MLDLVQKFVSSCRVSDLRISTSEVIDCSRQLKLINSVDEEQFKTVLRANFAKSHRDQAKFDYLYNLFFKSMNEDADLSGFESYDDQINDVLDLLKNQNDLNDLDNSIMEFLDGEPKDFLSEIQSIRDMEDYDTPRVVKSNMAQLAGKLQIMLQLNKTKDRILELVKNQENYSDDEREAIDSHFRNLLNTANSLINKDPRPYNESIKNVQSHNKHYDKIGESPFSSLTSEEIEEVRVVIDKLVKKLKDIVSRRYYSKNKGVLDIKKTIRRSAKYHNIPIEIKFKDKPLRKGKVVTLCDISGSVWSAARFMLNLLYSLQDCFSKVKSYVFVSELADVTSFFQDYEINEAIKKVLTDTDINYEANTDYGETFSMFRRDHLHELDKKTTLIIIGDARSNYFNPQQNILNEMRDRCRRVIWLNPEEEKFWDTGDSEMYNYLPYCHEVRSCNNLNQLIDFIEELIL